MVKKHKYHISNRLLYTLITIGILAILIVGVYAYGTSNPSVFGHSLGELQTCDSEGQTLVMQGGSWACATGGTGGSSQWTSSGSDIYFPATGSTGNVGIGTTDPQLKLHVAGDAVATGQLGFGGALLSTQSGSSCTNGTVIAKKWASRTCTETNIVCFSSCNTPSTWSEYPPTCTYQAYTGGLGGSCLTATCTANTVSSVACVGE